MLRACPILISLFVLLPLCAPAQEITPAEQSNIVREVGRMTQSLDKLIRLLKEQHSNNARADELQKLEIAVSYLNFRSRRIEAKEQDLKGKKEYRDRLEEMIAKLKEQAQKRERSSENAQGSQPTLSSYSKQIADSRLKQYQQRIETLESETIILDIEIMDLVKGLSELESYVEKNLKLIP